MRISRLFGILISLSLLGAAQAVAQNTQVHPPNMPILPKPIPALHTGPPQRPPRVAMPFPIYDFKLLNGSFGWVSSNDKIYTTGDDGQTWADVTPANLHTPQNAYNVQIVSVAFSNPTHGWILWTYAVGLNDNQVAYSLSITRDGGETWTTKPLILPDMAPDQPFGEGTLKFIDSQHGWLNIPIVSSAAFELGATYYTSDGGKTWKPIPGAPPHSGEMLPIYTTQGWLLAFDGGKLYFLHNDTYSSPSLKDPQNPKEVASYTLPVFHGHRVGFESVTFSMPNSSHVNVVVFVTHDGGRTWKPDRRLSDIPVMAASGNHLRGTFANSTWIIPFAPPGKMPRIMHIHSG